MVSCRVDNSGSSLLSPHPRSGTFIAGKCHWNMSSVAVYMVVQAQRGVCVHLQIRWPRTLASKCPLVGLEYIGGAAHFIVWLAGWKHMHNI